MDVIETARLRLELLTEPALAALEAGDRAAASAAQGVGFPDDFPVGPGSLFLTWQLERMRAEPRNAPWCVRAVRLRESGEVVGHAGFHGPPWMIGRSEIGYSISAAHRRRGLATEAAGALVDWAFARGETRVYASVLPANAASMRVVAKLGFEQVGQQVDDVDGLEYVFAKDAAHP